MNFPNSSLRQLSEDLRESPQGEITFLAHSLMHIGMAHEIQKLPSLGLPSRLSHLQRNLSHPPDYTDEIVLSAEWADNAQRPLEDGESWNEGRRRTNTNIRYEFNEAGLPINPYFNSGFNGRGLLGAFAVNHAVDNGIIVVRNDENDIPTLYTLGILRKYDDNAPAFSGGFVKFNKTNNGEYVLDQDAIIDSQTEELFEEMISGSVPLLEEYRSQLGERVQSRIEKYQGQNKHLPDAHYLHEISEQEETQLKLQQVRDTDPEFMQRLRNHVALGHECFAGPALNDPRTTNNAWIETRLSWFFLDDKAWQDIIGKNPIYPYAFSAGDDSSGIVYHRIDKNLVTNAFASHGSMVCFMAASYLLKAQKDGWHIPLDVFNQVKQLKQDLNRIYKILDPSQQPH